MQRALPFILTALAAGALGVFLRPATASTPTVPPSYTGRLLENGVPVNGSRLVRVSLQTPAGAELCAESSPPTVTFTDGRFSVPLPAACAVATIAANNDLFIQLTVAGTALPATRITAVPYALEAAHANTASLANSATTAAGAVDGLATRLNGVDTSLTARLRGAGVGETANSVPSPNTQMMWQAGSSVVMTETPTGGTGTSKAVISFPNPFPAGVVTVLGTWGDTNTANIPVGYISTSPSAVEFAVDRPVGVNVRINWIAIGF